MTAQQITALAIKILAIWLLVNIVLYLPSIATLMASASQFSEIQFTASLSIAVFVGFLVAGLAVSYIMFRVANSVLSRVPKSPEQINIAPIFVLQVTGLFFIVSVLSILPGYVLSITKQASIQLSTYGYLAGYAFKIAVGAYLLVKPTVWSGWFNKLRGRG